VVGGAGLGLDGRGGLLLGTQLLHAVADLAGAVEEVERDPGGLGQSAEGDRLPGTDQFAQPVLGPGLGGGA
jgi:hypothetical protein